MAVSMYAIAVPTFQKQLTALDAILDKATEHAAAKKIDISVLLAARLYPDMFNLTRQVQLATDFAKAAPARLAGTPVPSFPDTETTMPEIKQRIAKTLALLADLQAGTAEWIGDETADGKGRRQGGDAYRAGLSAARVIPEFLFPLRHRLRHPAAQRP